jgi:regulatory protein
MPADAPETVADLATALRRSAMDSLARREHSRYELLIKLRKKFPEADESLIDSVLDKLHLDNLLSDQRFTEAYVRYRKSRGYGPLYIRHRLKGCRVAHEIINEHLDESDPDWVEVLRSTLSRKSTGSALNLKDRQRLQRFALARGFSTEHFRKAGSGDN